MVLRGCLEKSLYALYLHKKPDLQETWLNRHKSEECKNQVRGEFQIKKIKECLKSIDESVYDRACYLYDFTIDYGAHPNDKALLTNLSIQEDENTKTFDQIFLTGGTLQLGLCLKTTAQIGVCSLDIFGLVFREGFCNFKIPAKLAKIKKGL